MVGTTSTVEGRPSSERPRRCPGSFTKRGTPGDLSRRWGGTPIAGCGPAGTTTRGRRSRRRGRRPRCCVGAQASDDPPQHPIGVSDLEEMSLEGLLHQPAIVAPTGPPLEAREVRAVDEVLPPGGEVLPWDVRQTDVKEVERRGRVIGVDPAEEACDLFVACSRSSLSAPGPLGRGVTALGSGSRRTSGPPAAGRRPGRPGGAGAERRR